MKELNQAEVAEVSGAALSGVALSEAEIITNFKKYLANQPRLFAEVLETKNEVVHQWIQPAFDDALANAGA